MKKTLLVLLFGSIVSAHAQDVLWSDDFDDEDITDWTLVDVDGDGFDWGAVQIEDNDGNPVGTPVLRSASWNQVEGPLTPNNWAIAPALDLSNYPAGSTITLNWSVMAIDAAYDAEKYSVYVSTSDDPAVMITSATTVTENTLNGVNTLTPRTLNISAFAGQAVVYVAFRHWGVSDQFTMEIDDVSVTATALGTSEFFANNFRMYPNPATNVINLTSANTTFNAVEVTDINGRTVKTLSYTGVANAEINISDLSSGMYFLKVISDIGTGTTKVIKN
jgi:hypothetical protein